MLISKKPQRRLPIPLSLLFIPAAIGAYLIQMQLIPGLTAISNRTSPESTTMSSSCNPLIYGANSILHTQSHAIHLPTGFPEDDFPYTPHSDPIDLTPHFM